MTTAGQEQQTNSIHTSDLEMLAMRCMEDNTTSQLTEAAIGAGLEVHLW